MSAIGRDKLSTEELTRGATDVELRARREASYETPREEVQAMVPLTARRILDLGCSSGALGGALKERQPTTVVGVELNPDYAARARSRLDRVVVSDIDSFLDGSVPDEAPFDCLIAADVLEHLVDPWGALARAAELLAPGSTVVVSLPNVSYWFALWRLIRGGRWPREDFGIFDRTHLRWFTHEDALELVRGAGLRPIDVDPRCPGLDGWQLRVRQLVARTPLHRFLPIQYVISALKE